MGEAFKLLMIGAMYENGGNTTHRFLDGHPELFVYPFESQLGTRLVNDPLTSMFPVKYRWPVFELHSSCREDFRSIIDEECRVRARTPHVSKFRDMPFDFSDQQREECFLRWMDGRPRSRAALVEAFFRASREAWKDCSASPEVKYHVGYSPILVVDADKILRELPDAHFLHVVRNPWSAYAETKKRPVPLSLKAYLTAWVVNQFHAVTFQQEFPDRLHIVRIEDVMADPANTLGKLCVKLGLQKASSLCRPSWNGRELREVFPWGTIRQATPEANAETARELSSGERREVARFADPFLDRFGYRDFVS